MALLSDNYLKDFIAILVTTFLGALLYLKWCYGYWSRRNVVTPPVSLPFGNAANLFLQIIQFGEEFKNIYFEFKPKGLRYCGYYMFTQRALVVLDVELAKSIMTKDFSHFTNRNEYCNEEIDPFTGHLFALKGHKWRNLRVKLTPTFTSGKMKMMFPSLLNCSDELIRFMDELCARKEVINIKDVVSRFTTDIIGTCAFGIDCSTLRNPDSEFRKFGTEFEYSFLGVFAYYLSFTVPQILDIFRIPITHPDITRFYMNIVKETVEYREKNNVIRNDFMHLLIQLKNNVKLSDGDTPGQLKSEETENKVPNAITLEQMAAQAYLFFDAGSDTSSTTLTYSFYELVANPEIYHRLKNEIDEVLEKHDGKVTYNAIMDMNYLDMFVNEALRKYPPLGALVRSCTQRYKIPNSDIVIEKDDQVYIPILGIQHDPEYYPDPERFDPERFTPENKKKRHPYAWLPFGEGPRSCIGIRFGLMQTKLALVVLLKNYKFTLNSKTQTPLKLDSKNFFLAPVGGIWLDVEKIGG